MNQSNERRSRIATDIKRLAHSIRNIEEFYTRPVIAQEFRSLYEPYTEVRSQSEDNDNTTQQKGAPKHYRPSRHPLEQ